MAKRFVDTDVFKKKFVRNLNPIYKLFWFYITTDCNHAGIWECDFDVAALKIGEKIDSELAKKLFTGKIVELDGGTKWFIPSFIEFQYGQLSEKNRAHHSIISILRKYGLVDDKLLLKPLASPLQGDKDKDMDMEQEMEMEQEQEGGAGGNYLVPQMQSAFKKHIPAYLPDKNRDYRPLFSIAQFLCQQANVKGPPENHQERIIEAWDNITAYIATDKFYAQKSLSTISNHIQEITQKALHGEKSTAKSTGGKLNEDLLKTKLANRFGKSG